MLINFVGGSNGKVSLHYIDFLVDVFDFYSPAFCYPSNDTSLVQLFHYSYLSSYIFSAKQLLFPVLL